MKNSPFFIAPLIMAAGLLLSGGLAEASDITKAQRAYAAGNMTEAKTLFTAVLEGDPQNVAATNYLKMIAAREAQLGPGASKQADMQKLIIAEINFQEATLSEALKHMKGLAEKASSGKVIPNFVLQPSVNAAAPVSLQLTQIPLTSALEYIGNLTGTVFVYDAYAITVKPAPAPGS